LPAGVGLEGSGDAIWHPGRRLIWGGFGYRSEARAYEYVSEIFEATVLRLALRSEHFYHLDTCFCAVSESTVLLHSASLAPESAALVRAVFRDVIEVTDDEALRGMACNACALFGGSVVIQRGNPRTVAALRERGFEVVEVETGEFLKSGGSVFCMKMYVI
jgi:N-dimethylarginine dimethylaminohydrolase